MASIFRRAAPIAARSLTSSSSPSSSLLRSLSRETIDLLKVLDSEIKFASQDYKQPEKLPRGFPFAIKDEKGTKVIFLERSYRNERIKVLVSMPNLIPGAELDDNDDDEESGDGNNGDEEDGQFSIPLVVNVSREGSSLELCCTAYPHEIEIYAMHLKRNGKERDGEKLAYGGPHFNHLDKKLQNALHNYMEKKGIRDQQR